MYTVCESYLEKQGVFSQKELNLLSYPIPTWILGKIVLGWMNCGCLNSCCVWQHNYDWIASAVFISHLQYFWIINCFNDHGIDFALFFKNCLVTCLLKSHFFCKESLTWLIQGTFVVKNTIILVFFLCIRFNFKSHSLILFKYNIILEDWLNFNGNFE